MDWADEKARQITGPCTCGDAYLCRKLNAPDCAFHNYADDIAAALRENNAAFLEAEAERLRHSVTQGAWLISDWCRVRAAELRGGR